MQNAYRAANSVLNTFADQTPIWRPTNPPRQALQAMGEQIPLPLHPARYSCTICDHIIIGLHTWNTRTRFLKAIASHLPFPSAPPDLPRQHWMRKSVVPRSSLPDNRGTGLLRGSCFQLLAQLEPWVTGSFS
ncbi:hypothetical protein BJX76DRAFT_330191 [Aspergillus varians]